MKLTRRQFNHLMLLGVPGVTFPAGALAGYLPECLEKKGVPKTVDVDVHCHVFNGSDIQVALFLRKVVAPESSGLKRKVIEALADPLQNAAWRGAPHGEKELGKLASFGPARAMLDLSSGKIREIVQESLKEATEAFAQHFGAALKEKDGAAFLRVYVEFVRSLGNSNAAIQKALAENVIQSELEILSSPAGLLKQLEAEQRVQGLPRIFTFARTFFNYRFINAHYLLSNYGCDNGSVQLIAPALVDFDFGLGAKSPPPTGLPLQFQVMERISEVFGGRVLTYLPYDPWRHAISGRAMLDEALGFIKRGAAVGFKLYPPMGFAPWDNKKIPPSPDWPKDPAFPAKLDAALKMFWDAVSTLDIPVITHANPSNQAATSFKELGSPDNWKSLLQQSQYAKVRICFGHFGGQELLAAGKPAWPAGFLTLISSFEHAYGDVSYFSDILDPSLEPKLRQRLAAFLKASPNALDKTIYGSDWSMIAIEPRAEIYFLGFANALGNASQFGANARGSVLGKNAVRFLGLNSGAASRSRLVNFYNSKKITAQWPNLIP